MVPDRRPFVLLFLLSHRHRVALSFQVSQFPFQLAIALQSIRIQNPLPDRFLNGTTGFAIVPAIGKATRVGPYLDVGKGAVHSPVNPPQSSKGNAENPFLRRYSLFSCVNVSVAWAYGITPFK
jgi:hypothetical protein